MARRSRVKLSVEMLEDRLTPSLTIVTNVLGNLSISGTPLFDATNPTPHSSDTITVDEIAPRTYSIVETPFVGAPIVVATVPASNNVTVDFSKSSLNDTVLFLNNGNTTGGSLSINMGKGFETVDVGDGFSGGRIGGSVTLTNVNSGFFSSPAGAYSVGGNFTLNNAPKLNDTNYLIQGGTIGGNVGFSAVNGNDGLFLVGGSTVGGNVTVRIGNGNNSFSTDSSTTIRGSVSYAGGLGNDAVTLAGTIGGSVSVNPGPGKNAVALGGTVAGSLTLNGGDGNDTVSTDTTASVAGNMSIMEGNGNDSLTLDGEVSGNLNVTLGNGTDTVTLDGGVSGNLNVMLGNGNDTVTIGSAPAGRLFWHSGNGNDSVTFGDGTTAAGKTWNVQMQFGSGSDTLTLAGPATQTLTGFIDMGGPPGGNSFDPTGLLSAGTWVIVSSFTLQNV